MAAAVSMLKSHKEGEQVDSQQEKEEEQEQWQMSTPPHSGPPPRPQV